MQAKDRIIVALDVPTTAEALNLVKELHPYVGCFKVGLELLTSEGAPQVIKAIKDAGGKVFYDGKFMDIPNTIAGSVRPVTKMGVDIFNVHCLGGKEMMRVAKVTATETATLSGKPCPLILGVTILTSLSHDDMVELGVFKPLNIADQKELSDQKRKEMEWIVAHQLAYLAQESGLDGVIASPQEIKAIRAYCQPEFLIVTPGVRPLWAATGDQKRVMTPGEAIKAGANYLVIGRPITKPPLEMHGAVEAAKKITDEIMSALAERIFTQTKAIITGSHIVYTSGKHGSEYVNKDEVYVDTEATDELCEYIAEHFKESGIEVVVAPVEGGINLSQGVARHLTKMTGKKVLSVYADKEGEGLALKRGYGKYIPGKRVLVVDDVFTTGGSVKKLVELVRSLKGDVMAVGGLCNRGGVKSEDIAPLLPEFFTLTNVQMEMHDPADCPLCKKDIPINTEVGKGKEYLAQKAKA